MNRLRPLGQQRWSPYLLALALYSGIALVFFGWPLADLGHRCLCDGSADPEAYMWELAWWPHAIATGVNPFITHAIWAPDAFNLAQVASIPGPSLLSFPLTALIGPLGTYDLLALAAPVLSGVTAFALCRYVTDDVASGLVGGALFGFSSYEIGQLTEHLNLALVFLIPLAVLLVLRLIDDRISTRRFVVLMALLFSLQLLVSTEIAATGASLGLVAIAVAYLAGNRGLRARLARTLKAIVFAGVIAAVATSPFLYYTVQGGFSSHTSPFVSADAVGWFIPTKAIRAGPRLFSSIEARFTTSTAENGAYVPLPFLVLAAVGLGLIWRRTSGRVLAAVTALAVLVASGPRLEVAGKQTIPLPWTVVKNMRVFEQVAPVRFTLYVWLAVAVLATLALRRAPRRRGALWRWGLVAMGLVLMIPNTGANLWRDRPSDPGFFSSGVYSRFIARNEVVLLLPAPIVNRSGANLWQARTRMYFRTAEGYLGPIFPADYKRDPVLIPLLDDRPRSITPPQLRLFLSRHRVQAVVLDGSRPGSWPTVLARLGLAARRIGGVLLYRVPNARAPTR